tara:strand:+ start:2740 stop:2922 length:183 start_codon:yes stop_codon:yes gene_type:complete
LFGLSDEIAAKSGLNIGEFDTYERPFWRYLLRCRKAGTQVQTNTASAKSEKRMAGASNDI